MRLALYQPDIPQNTGTLLRLAACLGIEMDIIEPCGFVFSKENLKRAGMDYLDMVTYRRHDSWYDFLEYRKENKEEYGRIVLLTTKTNKAYTNFSYKKNDILLLGRESKGVPESVHELVDERVTIPMVSEARSVNIAVAGTMVLGEALRQTDSFVK